MLKRLSISFWVILAFTMLQVHNFIPHEHTGSDHISHNQENHNDHHDESDDQTDHHESPLNDLDHNADFGKVLSKSHFYKDIIEKPSFSEGILIRLYDKLAPLENSPRPHPPDNDSPLHLIFLSHSLPLRAPPASSIS
jgi:hypothetical protein